MLNTMEQHRLCLLRSIRTRKQCNIEYIKCAYREAEKLEQRRLNIHIIDSNVMEQGGIMSTREKLYTNKCRGTPCPKEVDKDGREKRWQQSSGIEQKGDHTRKRFEHPAEH